ncbi:hypothetical protein J7L06_06115 [Candidatus Bathyarchaeota archaeon]|nr:hypothetical protein [Candidatus Bathyarchaeota archaeon]
MTVDEKKPGFLSKVWKVGLPLPSSILLEWSIMTLIIALAVMIRLLPLRWGFYLSEFDPYFHYRASQHIIKNGFFSLASWHDTMGWYPYGRDVAKIYLPGLAMTTVSLYYVLNFIGISISLFNLCVIFPVIMAAIACIVIYLLGRYIGGRSVGLLTAFFLALNASYISRTSLGFFDDETIGVLGIIVVSYLFLKAIDEDRELKSTVLYALGAGLTLGYISASWGAVRYPIDLIALYVLVLLFMRRYSSKLLVASTVTYAVAFSIAVNVPKLGLGFLTEASNIPVYIVISLLVLTELHRRFKLSRKAPVFLLGAATILVIAVLLASFYGLIRLPAGKFVSVVLPFGRSRNPLLESVAEHKPSAWGNFYVDLGIIVFLFSLGIYFAVKDLTNKNLFLLIYGLTSLYFSASMIRLMLIAAPAFCLLSAFGVVKLLKPFFIELRELKLFSVRRRFRAIRISKEYHLTAIVLVFLLLTVNYAFPEPRVYLSAYTPTTIAAASLPVKLTTAVPDWLLALSWMRDNLPPDAVVVSWWDYGYWITTLGNHTTVVDNSTFNTTQIQNVARMFMSNETEALKILRRYNATHVVVFTTFYSDGRDIGWGDEGKWMWMARIAGLNESSFGRYAQGSWQWNDLGKNTTIYKLMNYARARWLGMPSTPPEFFQLVYTSPGTTFMIGNRHCVILVCIYKVNYPT